MAYRETRDGKDTGWFYGEAHVTKPGEAPKRFRHRFDTMKAAQGYEVYVKLMGEEPPTMGASTSGRTFASVAQECKAKGGPRGKWLRGRDQSIVQRVEYVTGIVGHIDIAAFARGDYQLIVESLRKRPPCAANNKLRGPAKGSTVISNATINRYLNAASAVLTFAVKAEYRPGKPETPLLPEEENERAILTSYEAEAAILSAMEARGDLVEALCVRVLVQSGMREGELLDWLQPRQITIETDEDQNEYGCIHFEGKQTKNSSYRKAYIDADIARQIRTVMADGKLPSASHLVSTFKRAAKACGEPENLLIHSLRHTTNTRMRKEGVDIKIRMKVLGHKTVKTSMRYDHIDDGDQLEAAKKLRTARGKPTETAAVIPFAPLKSVG